MQTGITKTDYGRLPDGSAVDRYTLRNRHGVTASLLTLGATLSELHAPDRSGTLADIVLGFDHLDGWRNPGNPYMGCIVGRYANRIARGRFTLDGKVYSLAINNGTCSLHGGTRGFDKHVWRATGISSPEGPSVEFRHTSPDGDEGYPGNLEVAVIYTLTDANELRLDYRAETDKPTVLNLTHHAYWNLAGGGDVLDHLLLIPSSHITEVSDESIPTGRLQAVAGTALDFTRPTAVGARLQELGNEPLGYDFNYVLERPADGGACLAARVEHPGSGRVLEVHTTEPGVQCYTGNYLDGSLLGKGGRRYPQYAGLCLEAQHYPDSPNHPHFPGVVLRPGELYRQTTTHRFAVAK